MKTLPTGRTGTEMPALGMPADREVAPIRVLWLIKGLGSGGAERLLCLLAEMKDPTAVEYEVAYLLPEKSDLVPELERLGVTVHCLEGGSEFNLGWALRFRRLLHDRPVDIVHFHSPYPAGIGRFVVRLIRRSRRPKLISTEHVPWWGYARATKLLNAATFGLDEAHITVSEAVRRSIPRRFQHSTQTVIHGIDVERTSSEARFRRQTRDELGVAPGEVLVGTIANFRAQKDYPTLMAAAKEVLDRGLPARFVAVGQGREEAEIRSLHQRLHFGDRFLLLGYRPDAVRILAACDVFVLSSSFEGLPIALMEAFAIGLPIVATAVGGVPELVTDGEQGLLVPPGEPRQLAAAMSTLISDHELRAGMGAASKRRASAVDVRAAARRIEAFYGQVLGR